MVEYFSRYTDIVIYLINFLVLDIQVISTTKHIQILNYLLKLSEGQCCFTL